MKSLSKKIVVSLIVILFLFFFFPQPVLAQTWNDCLDPASGDKQVATLKCIEVIFRIILNSVTRLAVVALFIILVLGGFRYITSGGDPKKTAAAQNTLTMAVLGLVLLIVIWLIFLFIEKFTGVKVTNFVIPG